MRLQALPRGRRAAAGVLTCLHVCASVAGAELLPVQSFTTEHGLAHEHVRCIRRDSRGFLWLCTAAGVSRFDGSRFVSFTPATGLPSAAVHDVLEVGDAVFLVATELGLYRLDATRDAIVSRVPLGAGRASAARRLHRDARRRMWVGTDDGLYVLDPQRGLEVARRVELPGVAVGPAASVRALLDGPDGSLWIGGGMGVARRRADGSVESAVGPDAAPMVRALANGGDGGLWIGTEQGLFRWRPARADRPAQLQRPGSESGFSGQRVRSLLLARDGTLWVGAVGGLFALDGARFRRYAVANGLADETINAIAEDAAGNLWLGTDLGGALRVAAGGLTTYQQADGLGLDSVGSLFESRSGALHVVSEVRAILSRFDGRRFAAAQPMLPAAAADAAVRTPTPALQDHRGEWWIGSDTGLFRFASTERIEDLARHGPLATYGPRDGLPAARVERLFEDSRGDLWVGTATSDRGALARWQRAGEIFRPQESSDGLPASGKPTAFAETAPGDLWIGWSRGELLRHRGGRFLLVRRGGGDEVSDLLVDAEGRLWIGTRGSGILRVDRPAAPTPAIAALAVEGLASADVRSLVEDRWGRIYIGTVDGIDRLSPRTGHVRHYSRDEGLAQLETSVALRDRHGDLWFGTYGGLSRLVPRLEPPPLRPEVWIEAVRVDGVPVPISPLGMAELPPLSLDGGRHQLEVAFVGLSHAVGEPLRYQYRLAGSEGSHGWSEPTRDQRILLADVGPGRHALAVRAVSGDAVSARAATASFTIAPPFWRRGWVVGLSAALLVATLLSAHRLRVAHLLALERIRSRIATDLHDDLGASLTRVSLLSEVARRQLAGDPAQAGRLLDEIGEAARTLIEHAGDIVWAIDPRRDELESLASRVQGFAVELLGPRGIRCSVEMRGDVERARLAPERRRQLLLLLKEALHNAARHSDASRVAVTLTARRNALLVEIDDDGRGFTAERLRESAVDHLGLTGMRRRARDLGGDLIVDSTPGRGTRIAVEVPPA